MIGEVVYTSAPSGLRPGASGFCTVAATRGISKRDQLALESLSGYEFAFGISDARAADNPPCFLHTTVASGVGRRHVLSRVAFAGADHTGRSNKIAHHLLLDADEELEDGPAAVIHRLERSDAWTKRWEEAPRELETAALRERLGPPLRRGPARAWAERTGDAGWAGALARAFRARPDVPAFVVFEPGTDVLSLFAESLAVLPPEERWKVAFSTYFAGALPPDVACQWRAVLAGSTATALCARFPAATVIDLTRPLPAPTEDEFSDAARQGASLPSPVTLSAPTVAKGRKKSRKRAERESSATEPSLELVSSAEKGDSRHWHLRLGQGTEIRSASGTSGQPPWVYLAGAALVLGLMIAIWLSGRSPAPAFQGPQSDRVSPRAVNDGIDVKTQRAHTEEPRPNPEGTGARASDDRATSQAQPGTPVGSSSQTERTSTDATKNASSWGANGGVPGASTQAKSDPGFNAGSSSVSVVDSGTRLRLQLESGLRDPATVAPLTTSVMPVRHTEGSWCWSIPSSNRDWVVIDGRLPRQGGASRPYVRLIHDENEGAVRVVTVDRATLTGVLVLGLLTVDVGASCMVRLEPDSNVDAGERDEILDALVFEIREAESGYTYLLPIRSGSKLREETIGCAADTWESPEVKLSWTLPGVRQLNGTGTVLATYPRPRVFVRDPRADRLRPVATEGDEAVRVKAFDSGADVLLDSQRYESLAKKIKELTAGQREGVAHVASNMQLGWNGAQQARDAYSHGQRHTRPAKEAEQRLRDFNQRARALNEFLVLVRELAQRLDGLELHVLDPWGLPREVVRFRFDVGWTLDFKQPQPPGGRQ